MDYKFYEREGLYYNDEYITDFCPEVVSVKHFYYLDSGTKKRVFGIKLKRNDGTETEVVDIENLSTISYFDLWNVPDCDLTGKQKKRLIHKLQMDAAAIEEERIIIGKQGLYSYEDAWIYNWGNKVVTTRDLDTNLKIQVNTKLAIKQYELPMNKYDVISKYLNFLPGISEIVFYGALFAVVKPIFCKCGLKPDFILAVIGPSGHLKTSLVRKYALWMDEQTVQESSFRDYKRTDQIINMLNVIPGQNFLVDDFHETTSGNAAIKQRERLDGFVRHVGLHTNCANVFITGESSKKMGIFSSMDRLLQIKIPKKTSDELKNLKIKINELHDGEMATLASRFLKCLMEDFDKVEEIVKNYWSNDCPESDNNVNYNTRTYQHGKFIRLTEILFNKYMCFEFPDASGKEQLDDALQKNYVLQQKELQCQWEGEIERDYVIDVNTMLTSNDTYIKMETTRGLYQVNDKNCLYYENKVYITRNALVRGMSEYYQAIAPIKKIVDALHEAGILEEDNDSRTKKIFNKRHYVLSTEMIKRYQKWNSN